MIAAVRIRGGVRLGKKAENTLKMLRLFKPNHCVLLPEKPEIFGMLKKVQHYITWGEIDRETIEQLVKVRGRMAGKRLDDNTAKIVVQKILKGELKDIQIKPVFRLNPPSKGYKSIRSVWPDGDLGYRGVEINNLLRRMI
jgi:large subunit ribosomal protein L30